MTSTKARYRFAILSCENGEKWKYQEKIPNVNGLINMFCKDFIMGFGEGDDQWDIFKCYENEWPTVENAKEQYDALFLTGSHYGVHEESEQKWIVPLREILKLYCEQGIKIIGTCFGCQILAMSLGADVGRNPSLKYALKIEEVKLADSENIFSKITKRSLRLIESHRDQLLSLPEGAVCLASSDTALYEIWMYADRVLGIQSHPEFNPEIVIQKIPPALLTIKQIDEAEAEESIKSLRGGNLDSELICCCIREFVHSEPPKNFSIEKKTVTGEVEGNLDLKMEKLSDQMKDVILKKLRDGLTDYERLEDGNKIVNKNFKSMLEEIKDTNNELEVIHEIKQQTKSGIIQVIEEIGDAVDQIEKSIEVLDEETTYLESKKNPK